MKYIQLVILNSTEAFKLNNALEYFAYFLTPFFSIRRELQLWIVTKIPFSLKVTYSQFSYMRM